MLVLELGEGVPASLLLTFALRPLSAVGTGPGAAAGVGETVDWMGELEPGGGGDIAKHERANASDATIEGEGVR